jgi:hypothetical protein
VVLLLPSWILLISTFPQISRKEKSTKRRKKYAQAIKHISKAYYAGSDYVEEAHKAARKLYTDGDVKVLFKPNEVKDAQFRPVAGQAMSFIAGGKLDDYLGFEVPASFAVIGSKGWSDVEFENHQMEVTDNIAIAVGKCYLTCAETSGITEVEFTAGYKKDEDGMVGIFFHNLSMPLSPADFDENAFISEEAVQNAQTAWASAIKNISKTYLDGGDYVAVAAGAAGELYGYGHSDVLFKPTKAAEAQFRPSASDAMSYFVGHQAVEGGYAEDTGFAINGGKGWSDVVFENHQTKQTGNLAIAMGNYYFTCAETGVTTKVEYTFGYKKMGDNKLRIFLHHSSVPYNS